MAGSEAHVGCFQCQNCGHDLEHTSGGLLKAERLVCNRHREAGAGGRDAGRGAAAEAARDHDQILPIESHVIAAHFANAYKRGSRHAQPSS
jgi:LIM domain